MILDYSTLLQYEYWGPAVLTISHSSSENYVSFSFLKYHILNHLLPFFKNKCSEFFLLKHHMFGHWWMGWGELFDITMTSSFVERFLSGLRSR